MRQSQSSVSGPQRESVGSGPGDDSRLSSAKSSTTNLHEQMTWRRPSAASDKDKGIGYLPPASRQASSAKGERHLMEKPSTEHREDTPDEDTYLETKKLAIRERIRHFTWTWFTMTMATGGIANVLYVSLIITWVGDGGSNCLLGTLSQHHYGFMVSTSSAARSSS